MKVYEIFKSISGEVGLFPQGSQAIFIRFSGCNLNCSYCDAPEATDLKYAASLDPILILKEVEELSKGIIKNVVLTGGEPFFQDKKQLEKLCTYLVGNKYKISIETNGSICFLDCSFILNSESIGIVIDYKIDYHDKMEGLNYHLLSKNDFIKIVIKDENDLRKAIIFHHNINYLRKVPVKIAYSPMISNNSKNILKEIQTKSKMISEVLSKENLDWILNIQLHKLVNMP